jgi:hypothetical protein
MDAKCPAIAGRRGFGQSVEGECFHAAWWTRESRLISRKIAARTHIAEVKSGGYVGVIRDLNRETLAQLPVMASAN